MDKFRRRFQHSELLLVLLSILVMNPANAQSTTAGTFYSQSPSNTDSIDCNFIATDTSITGVIRDDYIARARRHDLDIFQIAGLTLINNGQADTTADAASAALQQDSGASDVSCCIEMRRDGAIGNIVSPAGVVGGVITTLAAYNSLAALTGDARGDVMVVAGLTVCGAFTGSFNGCAGANDTMFININSANNVTWAHEFGHVQSLAHRPLSAANCSAAGNANVMFPIGCANRTNLNTAECSAYQSNSEL